MTQRTWIYVLKKNYFLDVYPHRNAKSFLNAINKTRISKNKTNLTQGQAVLKYKQYYKEQTQKNVVTENHSSTTCTQIVFKLVR